MSELPKPTSKALAKAITKALNQKCPHCALGLFLWEWSNVHPEIDGATTLHGLLEVLADFLDSIPKEMGPEILLTAVKQITYDCEEILRGTYKRGFDCNGQTHPGTESVQ